MKIRLKTAGWLFGFFRGFKIFILTLPMGLTSCLYERDLMSPYGAVIPGRHIFDFDYYDYQCELIPSSEPTKIEAVLNLYGDHGWKLSGLSVHDGASTTLCLVR